MHARVVDELGPAHRYPGNVRELEQCVRRVLLNGHCASDASVFTGGASDLSLTTRMERGELDAEALLRGYCELLYERSKSYVQVAKVTGLDRRTVRRHLLGSPSGTTRGPAKSRAPK